ncbi:MAG: 2-oxo acid dehydrogenase subunit E2, partial [Bryobacteraceae bacterium]
MPEIKEDPSLGINSWLQDELSHQFKFDRASVDQDWADFLQQTPPQNGGSVPSDSVLTNGDAAAPPPEPPTPTAAPPPQLVAPTSTAAAVVEPPPMPVAAPSVQDPPVPAPSTAVARQEVKTVGPGDQLVPLRGAAARIAENMVASLSIPVATSQRQVPVRVIEENRTLINKQRSLHGKGKISFTHIIAWAVVQAARANPSLNHAFAENGGELFRVVRNYVNIGLAVDVAAKDGSRSLKVPNIKNVDGMNFAQFCAAYDDIVQRTRNNKLQLSDFEGTTISLTNPGTVGTLGSVPRLMPGQGAIIATGAIDYPAEFAATSEEVRAMLGLSKVLMISCTYD